MLACMCACSTLVSSKYSYSQTDMQCQVCRHVHLYVRMHAIRSLCHWSIWASPRTGVCTYQQCKVFFLPGSEPAGLMQALYRQRESVVRCVHVAMDCGNGVGVRVLLSQRKSQNKRQFSKRIMEQRTALRFLLAREEGWSFVGNKGSIVLSLVCQQTL